MTGSLEKILKTLRENKGNYISGEELAEQLNISRIAVWKHVQTLRGEGYRIESKPRRGYRLLRSPDLLLPWEIRDGLRATFIGHDIRYFEEVGSTQEVAKRLANDGAKEGAIVIAERQSNGRGRMGRGWFSPSGGVWLSVILRPRTNLQAQRFTLLAGVAVARAVNLFYGLEAKIKWPNDILVNGKKVCGILAEVSAEMDAINYLILGIGVNVNVYLTTADGKLLQTATSIKEVLGRKVSRVGFVQVMLEELEQLYRLLSAEGFKPILSEWKKLSGILGAWIRVSFRGEEFEGWARDVDEDGFLIVELDDGSLRRVVAGDVHIVEGASQRVHSRG